ncbi:MAG: M20/M25/M40 family metallo-hydrolase [Acidobacteriales bacterium]|nr:M20/M25/M40 family metallo-hydrolase [Terriglobales bacterium]
MANAAEARGVRECLQWFTREKQWINERHIELCRIPAPTFLEQARGEWMAAQFRALGWRVETDRAGNVVATSAELAQAPSAALTAHLDTVLAPRRPEEILVSGDGRFLGPGVADNGAGLAALLAVAAALKSAPESDWGQSIALVANVGEEGEGNLSGMRYLCRQSPLAATLKSFVVLDGPGTDTITAHALGSRRFEVVFTGPGGHSWTDYGTANPVHALCRAVVLFNDTQGGDAPAGEPRSSFNFGIIDGGMSINSIPSEARAKVDLRAETQSKMDELADLLNDCVERALETENDRTSGGKLAVRIREIGSRPSGRLSERAAILDVLRSVDQHLGIRAQLDCSSTDANIPISLGLDAVSIGAGGQGGGAHTTAEWYNPEGRDLGLKRVLLAMCLMAGRSQEAGGLS